MTSCFVHQHARGPVWARAALLSLSLALPAVAESQGRDSTVAVVQRRVNAGDRAGARQYADSVLSTVPDGSMAHAEALYARAFASSSAVEAERDYLRVSVEYALSPRAEDATMMVAQLKLARGDRLGARRNFERLVREHPEGGQAAKAAFWAGRLAVEDGDLPRGCQSLARARQGVAGDDVELGNQVEYYLQRCSPAALAAAQPPTIDTQPPAATPERTPPRTPTRPPARPPVRAPVPEPVRDSAPPTVVEPPPSAAPPAVERPAVPTTEYSVQVAAFPKQRDADALAEVLKQRGFPVRVWGTKAPYRVRVGRYPSREEAEAARARMRASRVNGMVVEAERP